MRFQGSAERAEFGAPERQDPPTFSWPRREAFLTPRGAGHYSPIGFRPGRGTSGGLLAVHHCAVEQT